ncbi:MAG: T9SS type A sorting domain-containing protein, partial [candidate division Zixibacteria bacterium]|nr:T9SS type A sorting domain-containing protein [candidate division Zixibacteria bacterium]
IINGFSFNFPPHNFDQGGAVRCSSSSPVIRNCLFSANSSVRGGAIYCKDLASPLIESCEFSNNFSNHYGGSFYCEDEGNPIVSNCVFKDCSSGAHAGSICIARSSPTFNSCTVIRPKALELGGAVFIQDGSLPVFDGCTFYGASSGKGSSFFVDQRSGQPSPTEPLFNNCIISFGTGDSAFHISGSAAPSFSCTDIFGTAEGDWTAPISAQQNTNNNFSLDPLFCDTSTGDLQLNSTSPGSPQNSPCGVLVGALGVGCEPTVSQVLNLDIKPGSCPNPFNIRGREAHGNAVLPVALLGTTDFDVRDVDVSTLALEGVGPVRHGFDDVSAPPEFTIECGCVEDSVDGHEDLTLKFLRSEVIAALGDLSGVSQLRLTLTGKLNDGSEFSASDCIVIRPKAGAGAESIGESGVPDDFTLIGNYPNPFNPVTKITFGTPRAALVTISIYNILGQKVATLLNEERPAGYHTVIWDASSATSGVYFYRLMADGFVEKRKMVLLK